MTPSTSVLDRPELAQLEKIFGSVPEYPDRGGGEQPTVLFFNLRNWMMHVAWQNVMAAGLRLRGANPIFFTCGGGLSLCGMVTCHSANPTPCHNCYPYIRKSLERFGHPHFVLKDFISDPEIGEARRLVEAVPDDRAADFEYDGLPLGEMIKYSVRWYLRSGTLDDHPRTHQVTRRILTDAAVMTRVIPRLLDTVKPQAVVVNNGLIFAEQIMVRLARARGIDVVTYETGRFVPDTLYFNRSGNATSYDISEAWQKHKDIPLTPQENEALDRYLQGRSHGKNGTARFWPSINQDVGQIVTSLGLDRSKKIVTLFTNVVGDTASQDKDLAFPGMLEWVVETVRYFMNQDHTQLIVRIHPGEVKPHFLQSADRVQSALRDGFPNLTGHIKIIAPESDFSSYALMDVSDAGLVYTSTAGLELLLRNKPVLVAGKTHYRGRGFTEELNTRKDYFSRLERLLHDPKGMSVPLERARRYAYTLFFRCLIPFDLVRDVEFGVPEYTFSSMKDLAPGAHPGLDRICSAILKHQDFSMVCP